jgi:peptidoglycan hydrolase CwlO-like protein
VIVDKMLREMRIKDVRFLNCDFALFISIYFIIVIINMIRDNQIYMISFDYTRVKTSEAFRRGRVPYAEDKVPDVEDKVSDAEDKVPDAEDKVPDAEDKVFDAEDKVPDAEDKVPDAEDKVPDAEDKVPDAEDKVPDTEDTRGGRCTCS